MLLELLARSKSAGGVGEESFDAGALELARQYGDKATDKIAPAMSEVSQTWPHADGADRRSDQSAERLQAQYSFRES